MATDPSTEAQPLEVEPKHGQLIAHNGNSYATIKEGLAHILVPAAAINSRDAKKQAGKGTDTPTRQSVFYNPIQQFNRDLSVLAIKAFSEDYLAFRNIRSETARARRQEKRKGKKLRAHAFDAGSGLAEPVQDPEAVAQQSTKRKADEAFSQEHTEQPESKTAKSDAELPADVPAAEAANADAPATTPTNGTSESPPKPEPTFRILDALSATGLRALRYAHEIPVVTEVVANDLSRGAVESIKLNVAHNKLDHKIHANQGNALGHMYAFAATSDSDSASKYHVVDLDPYGTAAPFLDAALHALQNGGLLCVTCTDAGVFASCGYPEKTYALYGGTPIKGAHSHEGGLRLILHAIASAAAKQGLAIEPLMSLSIDFYVRLWVRVRRSAAEVKHLAGKTMAVYSCDSGCGAWTTQPLARNEAFATRDGAVATKHTLAQGPGCGPHCPHCGFKTHVSGPMWGGPLHNPAFLRSILGMLPELDRTTYATLDRVEGMVSTALEEVESEDMFSADASDADAIADATAPKRPIPPMKPSALDSSPFFFLPSALAGVLHCQAPPEAPIKGALRRAGYKAVRSHTKPGSVKTNAPWTFLWRMMREWVRLKAPPIKEGSLKARSPGYVIMNGGDEQSRSADEQSRGPDEQSKGPNKPSSGAHKQSSETAPPSDEPTTDQPNQGSDAAPASNAKQPRENATARPAAIVFDAQLGKEPNKRRLVRYQENPRANWGPMNRAAD